jgi:hypothetical protein
VATSVFVAVEITDTSDPNAYTVVVSRP